MDSYKLQSLQSDLNSALKLCKAVKVVKLLLALSISLAYVLNWSWLPELLVASVVLVLVLPLGFFDVFIQRLLEYNTFCVEERQILNAREASEHIGILYNEIEKKIHNK
ncbi:hypothetical protein [Enterovibrio norvegicus]|uniref:hypothetical protein n=1 Tax=Enterovibrio norvegicus TaxID=188144 RepID=UPI0013D6338F|nr:hypothetical protein [Enterovibrio norvegicus]